MSDRADPWAETTYNGFAGAAELPPPPPRKRTRLPSRKIVIGGVAAGLALGAVLGLAARPRLGGHAADPAPMQPVPRAAAMLDIEVAQPPPLPAPKSKGRLEVLSPDLAHAVPRMAAAPTHVDPRPASNAEPDCSMADTVADQLVCEDPALSRADTRMRLAYARALKAGALPRRDLRNAQLDWLSTREAAARRSPFEVRSLYEQRIDELNALADGRGQASPAYP